MATRRETERRKAELRGDLRRACGEGGGHPGEILPPVTELAARYRLSINVVRQSLQPLIEEGLLYTVPRVGTFIGRPASSATEFYLLLLPAVPAPERSFLHQVQLGFENRIASLGGACLVIPAELAAEGQGRSSLPSAAGIFDFADGVPGGDLDRVPAVRFGAGHPGSTSDAVSFDDFDGGRQAARHLLGLGHRHIAFLALHVAAGDPGAFLWSSERERGWRAAMDASGWPTDRLSFHPAGPVDAGDQISACRRAAAGLLRRPDVTAVVAANDFAARGLLDSLLAADVPPEQWPALVSFDDSLQSSGYVVTSLRLPWEEVGRDAADLLWERRHGRLAGPPEHRKVPMRLIPRLTSRANWTRMAGDSVLAALEAAGRGLASP